MSPPTSLQVSASTISLPGLVDGHSPWSLLDGQQIGKYGRAVAHANLSARQAKERGLLTSGTYGHPGSGSSSSVGLQQSLESRLQVQPGMPGSILYSLTWKGWATPAGRQFCLLRASGLRTSDTGFIGWPTPRAREKGGLGSEARGLNPRNCRLEDTVLFAGWATATASNWRDGRASPATMDRNSRPLQEQAKMLLDADYPVRITAHGEILTGSSAGMDFSGQLNPEFSRWLMGFPTGWGFCGGMGTP